MNQPRHAVLRRTPPGGALQINSKARWALTNQPSNAWRCTAVPSKAKPLNSKARWALTNQPSSAPSRPAMLGLAIQLKDHSVVTNMAIRIHIEISPQDWDLNPSQLEMDVIRMLDPRTPTNTFELGQVIGKAVSRLKEIPGSRQDFLLGIHGAITKDQ